MPVSFPFYIGANVYVFSHGTSSWDKNIWRIQELRSGGHVSSTVTDSGTWKTFYAVVFPLYVEGNVFLYSHSEYGNRYYITKLLLEGELNTYATHDGSWDKFYSVMYPFEIDDEVYIYGQSNEDNEWFTTKVDSEGKLDNTEIQTKKWKSFYGTQFPFYVWWKEDSEAMESEQFSVKKNDFEA